MGKELQQAASAKLGTGRTFISQTWGLSETTGSVTFMPWGENDSTGSISPLLPNAMMRYVTHFHKAQISFYTCRG